jgi:hypothetical protein
MRAQPHAKGSSVQRPLTLIVKFRFTLCFHDCAAWSAAQASLRKTQIAMCATRRRAHQAMRERCPEALARIAQRCSAPLPMHAAIVAVLALTGCAQSSAPEPIQNASAEDTLACKPEPALLVPQSAPDCVFRRAELKTIDPDQWARLKIEYERQCYQNAEKTVRERLRRLQAGQPM